LLSYFSVRFSVFNKSKESDLLSKLGESKTDTAMNIAVKKIELIEWLAKIEDQSLLEQIDVLKRKAIAEAYESGMTPMSSEKFKSLLDEAESDYSNGRVTLIEDLEKESRNW
jgi:hypothetical protein